MNVQCLKFYSYSAFLAAEAADEDKKRHIAMNNSNAGLKS